MAGGPPSSSLPASSPPHHSSDFPSLVPQTVGADPCRAWSNLFDHIDSSSSKLNLSFYPSEPEIIPFSGDKLLHGAEDWKLCLVGYSVGKRPFYEALHAAVRKSWSLKGSFELHSLNDGFFLFRFSCSEDFDTVWTRGVWFLLGRPFIFQKWHPKFKPKRENLKSLSIWIKIHDLPLACWNSEGISRIASKVGIPLAADSLTTQKTRLTYARVCVQVGVDASYPEEIKVSLDGDVVNLKVQYEWRPNPCDHCKSLMHTSNLCSSKPDSILDVNHNTSVIPARGRSFSRKPRGRTSSGKSPHPGSRASIHPSTSPHKSRSHHTNFIGHPLHYQPHSPARMATNPVNLDVIENTLPMVGNLAPEIATNPIPNLNSPIEETSSSNCAGPLLDESAAPTINSPNRFEILQYQEEPNTVTSEPYSSVVVKNDDPKSAVQSSNTFSVPKKPTRGKNVKKPPPH
ncbi:hypothetical protein M5K25_002838 [Dendrobium thyrsiflorum]|uniref:DUF4283 domain-containing protein n=1 Tax=Dendrobium thyrsiflorum TaxID=117978 RepID=A0ABD0VNT1_DENTH